MKGRALAVSAFMVVLTGAFVVARVSLTSDATPLAATRAPSVPTVPGCPEADGFLPGTTVDELRTAVTGVWIRCSTSNILPSGWGPPEDGLELTADGHWYRITRTGDGALLRNQGDGSEGTYRLGTAVGNPPTVTQSFQLDLSTLAGFSMGASASRYATPAVLTLDDLMQTGARGGYTLWTGAPPTPAPPPAPAPGCPGAGGAYAPTDESDALTTLAGTWIRCSPGTFLPSDWGPAEAGLELTADGSWYRLYRGADGMPTRGTGAFDTGTYTVQLPEPGGSALGMAFDVTGITSFAQGTLYTQPRVLALHAGGIDPSRVGAYVAWDGNPLPAPSPPTTTPSGPALPPTL